VWFGIVLGTVFMIILVFILFMFIVYFGYMVSIVELSSYLCLSSYSIHPNVHRVGGRDHVSVVLICYLPMNILYILGHVVDRRYDTPVEPFVVHSSNIDYRSRAQLQRKGEVFILKLS
jgi:hypothetical protein